MYYMNEPALKQWPVAERGLSRTTGLTQRTHSLLHTGWAGLDSGLAECPVSSGSLLR